jgi:two-component system, NtrC family, sensor kinase
MRSLRSKISINLALLLFVTILSTHIVMLGIMGKEFISDKITREHQIFSEAAGRFFFQQAFGLENIGPYQWTYVCFLTNDDRQYCYGDNPGGMWDDIADMAAASLDSGKSGIYFRGETWGVLGKQHKYAIISDVILHESRVIGAGTVVVPLDDIYHVLRKSQKLVMVYLFVNMAIFLLFGIYRFSAIILKPIQKMIRMTEGYRDTGQMLFPVEKRHPELFQLSDAVHRMINHIEADKNRLLNSVALLEKANADLKRAQSEMIRAEKLASIGRLSAGLAHEIGNPIGIVMGYLGLIKQRSFAKTDEVALDYIDRSESEISRINAIVRQLLDFSRPGTGNACEFHLHNLLEDVVEMMSHQPLMKNVRMECAFTARFDDVIADPQQLRQVLLNLMINAADAIAVSSHPDVGEIRLMTDNLPGNRYIRLMVADNGIGIDLKNIDNIFDPFYTTKAPGKGTGLGLSVSYMIIEQFGGRLDVESEPGMGANMIITLPLPGQADRMTPE